jgi:hypothetical protein
MADITGKSYVCLKSVGDIFEYRIHKTQRAVDINHVKKIVQDQIEEYKRFGSYSILQSISVATINDDGIYVLDGQHRCQAFKELERLGYKVIDVIVPVVFYRVIDEMEMFKYFNMINSNMPIHPLELQSDFADYSKILVEKMSETYSVYMKNDSKNSRCPHINMNEFKKNLAGRDLGDKLKRGNFTINDFWNKIIEFNGYIRNNIKASHQLCAMMKKRIEDCDNKAQKFKIGDVCYLGVWRRFEWMDFALETLLGSKGFDEISLACEANVRIPIPYIIREQVWKKCNPNTGDLGTCFTCCNDLYFREMECGHIKAHALGGDISVDNLMPVCKTCNKDMGIMNLFEYKSMIEKMSR